MKELEENESKSNGGVNPIGVGVPGGADMRLALLRKREKRFLFSIHTNELH